MEDYNDMESWILMIAIGWFIYYGDFDDDDW
jgi:hypothetical protein